MYEDILNPAAVAARVKAGAEWLDEHEPGWADRIDPSKLHMDVDCGCIGGQLAGRFITFALLHKLSRQKCVTLGLLCSEELRPGQADESLSLISARAEEYDLLGHAFLAEIAARRTQQSTQPKGGA